VKKSAPNNPKATRDNAVSLLTLLHQLLFLIPERTQNQERNAENRKACRKLIAGEKVVDGFHDENELIDFGL
jgi:hypothetical protein